MKVNLFLGEYGIGLSWSFPFSFDYWKSNENKKILFQRKTSEESFESLEIGEDEKEIIVKIKSLIKYFPQTNRNVVDNVSFDLYENEITALLGHNGAGQTFFIYHLLNASELEPVRQSGSGPAGPDQTGPDRTTSENRPDETGFSPVHRCKIFTYVC
jgi:hypothetical protein